MSKEAFVYLWYDALNKMYYLGSHKGKPTDNYAHSSTVMESFTMNTKPTHMHRKILGEGTHDEMLLLERKLQLNRKERCWDRYYNVGVCSGVDNGPGFGEDHHMWGKKHSPEMIKRLSEANKGKIPWNKGIKYKCEKLSGKGHASYKHGRCVGMKDNPDTKRAYNKWFGDNNREALNRKEVERYANNKEEINKRAKERRLKNPDEYNRKQRERRARKRAERQDWVRGPYKKEYSPEELIIREEKRLTKMKEYGDNNRDKIRQRDTARRSKNKAETGYTVGYSRAKKKKKAEKQGVGTLKAFLKDD